MVKNSSLGINCELTFVTQIKECSLLKFFPVRLVHADLNRCRVAPVETTRISKVEGVFCIEVETFYLHVVFLLVFWTVVLPNPFGPVVLIFAFL